MKRQDGKVNEMGLNMVLFSADLASSNFNGVVGLVYRIMRHELISHGQAYEKIVDGRDLLNSIAQTLGIEQDDHVTFQSLVEEILTIAKDNSIDDLPEDEIINALAEVELSDEESKRYSQLLWQVKRGQLSGKALLDAIAEFMDESDDPEFGAFLTKYKGKDLSVRDMINNSQLTDWMIEGSM